MELMGRLITHGVSNVATYLAAHVLLCLLPAFFIAGAMTALIPRSSITRWLGPKTSTRVSYPAAAAAGSLLAVCSCTIVPLFAGIYRKGAGLGPAVIFLFFAQAGNIMALAYTGSILGAEFALARLLLCMLFGISIGLLMSFVFKQDESGRASSDSDVFSQQASLSSASLGVLLSLLALLLAGTLKLWPLTSELFSVSIRSNWLEMWHQQLFEWIPFDPAKGEEGVNVQGSLLIVLLFAVALTAYRGLDNIIEGSNPWTWVSLSLAALTLLIASLRMSPLMGGLQVVLTGRVLAVALSLGFFLRYLRRLSQQERQDFLWESWRFMKQIFPLLVIGVFVVGMIRVLINPMWIRNIAGNNDLTANAMAVLFGVFMYFPTLVEVPVARMFLDLGMHPGPLLAYLMADPELSFQSILMVSSHNVPPYPLFILFFFTRSLK
jgi:uncharacterized membrane protein YraQ (UPF0718 family)